jgi:hypothetical protein
MLSKWLKSLAVWALVLGLLGILCWRFMDYREEECSQTCVAQGKKYQYQGFTGWGRRSLGTDVCTCLP